MMPAFGRRAVPYLTTAVLLVLALVGGLAALWQPPLANDHHPPHVPALVRALASSSDDVVAEELLEATFPYEELPTGNVEIIFYRVTLPPGASLPYLAGPYYGSRADLATSGVGAEVVQTGTYRLRLGAPIRIQRTGRTVEEVPAAAEVMLGPGDTARYPNYTAGGTIRNTGDEPVVIVGVAIVGMDGSGSPRPTLPAAVIVEKLTLASPADWRALPAVPVSVSLWRLTLPAGRSVGPYEARGLETIHVESGAIQRSLVPPGEPAPRVHPLALMPGTATGVVSLPVGTRRIITSAGDDPATVLALSIEPASAWSGLLDS